MPRKDRFLCLIVCAAFGLFGGAASNLFLGSRQVTAQGESVVKAQRFEVVDENGHLSATLDTAKLTLYNSGSGKIATTLNDQGLTVYDNSGQSRLVLGVLADRVDFAIKPMLIMRDTKGKNIYEAK